MDSLTPDQEAELRADLRVLEAQLRALLELSAEGARPVELDQAAVGRVSRIDAIQQQQMNRAGRERARARLAQVRAALASDGYGECRRCDDPIGFARLKARPEAPFCVGCAGALEQR